MKPSIVSYCAAFLMPFAVSVTSAQAADASDVAEFIDKVKVETYDCPEGDNSNDIEAYLALPDVSRQHKFELNTIKAQGLICSGKFQDAMTLLKDITEDTAFDRTSAAYASAIYQIGFIHDVMEEGVRCDYYAQAEALAKDKFNDVHLSSQLGQITVCGDNQDDGIKLGQLYSLLESYSQKGDKAAIAHIHNNIGLVYGKLGQHVLAAEQYYKSYEMGLDEYTGTNLLATLISAIVSQFASGDYDAARRTIEEFKTTNLKVNTPLTNIWLHYAEAGLYYRVEDFDGLRDSLAKWKVFLPEVSDYQYKGFHRWYSAKLCLHERDRACLEEYLEAEEQAPASYRGYVRLNKDYVRLLVEIYFFLGETENAEKSFNLFADLMLKRAARQQASGKILGVANLHTQITTLESSLLRSERQRTWSIVVIVAAMVMLFSAIFIVVRKKFLARLASDPLTGLQNTRAVIDQIKRVSRPEEGKTNAIALFDLDKL